MTSNFLTPRTSSVALLSDYQAVGEDVFFFFFSITGAKKTSRPGRITVGRLSVHWDMDKHGLPGENHDVVSLARLINECADNVRNTLEGCRVRLCGVPKELMPGKTLLST